MYKDIINKIKPGLENALLHFKEELGALRTGRATPALIETVEVEAYGSRSALHQRARTQDFGGATLGPKYYQGNRKSDCYFPFRLVGGGDGRANQGERSSLDRGKPAGISQKFAPKNGIG